MRRCPDLFWDEEMGRYLCLLMADPDQGADARRELFQGQGCCAPLMDWRDNVRNRDNG